MKKCPYCKTFMNDDVNVCPHCLKDMTNLKPMENVSPKNNKSYFYTIVFSVIVCLGSILAYFSQRENEKKYYEQYKELLNMEQTDEVKSKISDRLISISSCQIRETLFIVIGVICIILIIYAIVRIIMASAKKKGK